MKKITLPILLLSSLFAGAQTITQSESLEVAAASTISCNAQGAAIADNHYFRFFELENDHDITSDYTITSVDFGIEGIVNLANGEYPITVRLYATTGSRADFPDDFADLTNMTLLGEETYQVPDQEVSVFTAAINGVVPAGSDLIVEIFYEGDPEGQTALFLGSNGEGETHPTYLMSPGAEGCQIDVPTPIEDIVANSTVHLVLSVTGTSETAGIEDNISSRLSVYPNPTKGMLGIQGAEAINNASLTDVSGKTFNVNVVSGSIDMSSLASGVYFLNLGTTEGSSIIKVVKE